MAIYMDDVWNNADYSIRAKIADINKKTGRLPSFIIVHPSFMAHMMGYKLNFNPYTFNGIYGIRVIQDHRIPEDTVYFISPKDVIHMKMLC